MSGIIQTQPPVVTYYGVQHATPTIINPYSCLTIPAFYSGVRFIAETLAGLKKGVSRDEGETNQWERAHPLNKLLVRRINPLTMPFVFYETLYHHCLVYGNGYAYIKRDNQFNPIGIYNLDPETVIPFRFIIENGGEPQQWYSVRQIQGVITGIIPASDIIHIPGLGYDSLVGFPVVYLMAETLEWARNAQKFGSTYLKRGTKVQGSIEIPGEATDEQVEQIQNLLKKRHSNIETGYDHLVLTGGATLKNSTIPPQQSQLIETMGATVLDVCRILRVPPHIVYQLDQEKYASIEQMSIDVVRFSLKSWIEKTEEELSAKLLAPAEQDAGLTVKFDLDDLLRGDSTSRTDNLLKLVNGGLQTANEARACLNLPPDESPEANKLRVPVSFPVPGLTDGGNPTRPGAALPPAQPKHAQHDDPPAPAAGPAAAPERFADALQPILADACNRVDAKTDKAFSNHGSKIGQDRTIWANVFSNEQEKYSRHALEPVAAALEQIQCKPLDLDAISTRYGQAIRARAAGGPGRTLIEILEGMNHEQK
jgi:HK97 family phage portal protein